MSSYTRSEVEQMIVYAAQMEAMAGFTSSTRKATGARSVAEVQKADGVIRESIGHGR